MAAAPVPVHLGAALEGLAENPALPMRLARRLVANRTDRVARRADLTADLINEIIATDSAALLHSLALNRHLPNAVRLRLARHPNPAVRAALVIAGRDVSAELFERLINDPDKWVRECLAQSDHAPACLRARLVHDPDPEVRATLAQWWPQAPEELRRILLTDPVDQVRAAACSTYYRRLPHPVPPTDLLPRLLDDPVTRAGAVKHAALTTQMAQRLANDPDYQVRGQLAQHPQLPASLRDQLADDSNASVRIGVFARPDTPEPQRHEIYFGILRGDSSRIDHLAEDLDQEALLQTAEDFIAGTELRNLCLEWVTADPLPYASSPYVCFRRSAACSRSLPEHAVLRLLNDGESIVRTTMARHAPHLVDPATAERIDRDFRPEKKTSWRPADDFTFPSQTLRRFASDSDPRMRCLAPRDPDLPADLAEQLAADPEASVRRAVAAHPLLPEHAIVTLLSDEDERVTRAAAGSPFLPMPEMERLLTFAGL
ncbi:MAG TPA: HEAT repeat domain-containing protein [Pseudonocardiaceae bacterium]